MKPNVVDGLSAGVFWNQVRFQTGAHLLRHRALHHAVLLLGIGTSASRVDPSAVTDWPFVDDIQGQLEPRIRTRKVFLYGRVSVLPLLHWHPQV